VRFRCIEAVTAHAFASIDGHTYTNSLEAFQRNYGLNKPFQEATWADLAGHRYLGRYTILRSQDLLRLLIDHPDIFVIPDLKWSGPEILRTYVRQAAALGRQDLLERLLPHVDDQAS